MDLEVAREAPADAGEHAIRAAALQALDRGSFDCVCVFMGSGSLAGARAAIRNDPESTLRTHILAAVAAVDEFAKKISDAYAFEGASIDLGRGVHDGTLERDAVVRLPLATTNRHGLIAGATGTGKTKTLQVLAEQLSAAGVSVFAADYKGDLSGLLEPAPADGPAAARMQELGPAVRAERLPGRVPVARRASGPACRCAPP